jgi:hypothetical protein
MSTLAKGMITPLNYTLVSSNSDYHNNWKAYKEDPYNPYILGLKYLVCNNTKDQERRNKALDHLLAINGESPYVVNEIIDDRAYFGTIMTNQLILKSLLLQNQELLSYNRQKAYNYQGASFLQLPDKLLPYQNPRKGENKEEREKIEKMNDETIDAIDKTFLESDFIDFVFRTKMINEREKIDRTDFQNFSALELKLCLIFGLRSIYKQHFNHALRAKRKNPSAGETIDEGITRSNSTAYYKTENEVLPCVKLWYWFIHELRGFIFIENRLLLLNAKFKLYILVWVDFELMVEDELEVLPLEVYYEVTYKDSRAMNYKNLSVATNIIENVSKEDLNKAIDENFEPNINLGDNPIGKLSFEKIDQKPKVSFEPLSNSASIGVLAEWYNEDAPTTQPFTFDARSEMFEEVTLIFPDQIEFFQSSSFHNRLDIFLDDNLPIRVRSTARYAKHEDLEKNIIPGFVAFHNSLRDKEVYKKDEPENSVTDDKDASVQSDLNSFYDEYINLLKYVLEEPNDIDDPEQST